ncbi:MAG: restriction endonuclease [Sulfurimicrobium sp.]|nr:restriction endonuclease [Sulfurimicrobium sp.]MDP1704583.1 restriction endonuclease [Sulfurimicrobium sp.]MDP2200200.1 restriction endonuclease [Sulfurimicrobium sp.]
MKDLFPYLLFAGIAWLIWQAFSSKATPPAQPSEPPPKEDPQKRHLRNALEFAKTQHKILSKEKREQDAWQQAHGHATASELDLHNGIEFEEFLAGLFRAHGYAAELTPVTGDYGADLILSKGGQRIAVQAKRYMGSVGVSAVQEALSGQAYYQCDAAWVVTTGTFTTNALELAGKSGVKMIGRSEIGNLMAQHKAKTNNG